MNNGYRTKWLKNIPSIHQDFYEFWRNIRPESGLPKRCDFDTTDLLPWFGNLHLVELLGDSDARYSVYGTNIGNLHGREWTGRRFSELDYPDPDRLLGYYQDVRDARKPLAHIVNATVETKHCQWSRLFVPLVNDSDEVSLILVHSILIDAESSEAIMSGEAKKQSTDDEEVNSAKFFFMVSSTDGKDRDPLPSFMAFPE
jgi:hypothetical protein